MIVNVNETIKLNGSQIPWVKEIKHLGNYMLTKHCQTSHADCQYKLSSFIGSVNKLIANFGNLQQDVMLDHLNLIVALSMVHKRGRLILLTANVYVLHMEQKC